MRVLLLAISLLVGIVLLGCCGATPSGVNTSSAQEETKPAANLSTIPPSLAGMQLPQNTQPAVDVCINITCPDRCEGSEKQFDGICQTTSRICIYQKEACLHGCENGTCLPPPIKDNTSSGTAGVSGVNETVAVVAKNVSNTTQCVRVKSFHYDASGNDNNNLNDEFLILENSCQYEVDVTGWTVEDAASHTYTLRAFILSAGASFSLHTGTGIDTNSDVYWGSKTAIWNNDGDTLRLKNSNGVLVLSYSYQ